MNKVGIKQFYNTKYDAKNPEFWKSIDLPNGPDKEYVCIGVKASNYFMPKETLSEKGPGGGGWILMVASSALASVQRVVDVGMGEMGSKMTSYRPSLNHKTCLLLHARNDSAGRV